MDSQDKGQGPSNSGTAEGNQSGATQKKMLHKQLSKGSNSSKKSKTKNKNSGAKSDELPVFSPKPQKPRKSFDGSSTNSVLYDNNIWPQLSSSGNMRNKPKKSPRPKSNLETAAERSTFRQKSLSSDQERPASHATFRTPDFNRHHRANLKASQPGFQPYIPLFEVQQGLKRGEFIEGALRINPRNYEDAYINCPTGQTDIYIRGMRDRNRALNADVVVVQLNPKQEWKVLCDAVKDYQEKHGQNVVESVYSPITSSCKVHTPEKLSRIQSRASSSWNGSVTTQRLKATESLELDKLAEGLSKTTIHSNKKNKCQAQQMKFTKLPSTEESESQKNSDSYSEDVSRDDNINPSNPSMHILPDQHNTPTSSKYNSSEKASECEENSKESRNASDLDMKQVFDPTTENIQDSDMLVTEDTHVSIVVSPDNLLDVGEGNPLQLFIDNNSVELTNTFSDCSDSPKGIAVAPDELTGDEFTDSASSSSLTHDTELVVENHDFLATEQDAENNNSNILDNCQTDVVNQSWTSDTICIMNADILVDKTYIQQSCKLEEKLLEIGTSTVAVVADSVCAEEVIIQNNNIIHVNQHCPSLESFPITLQPNVNNQKSEISKPAKVRKRGRKKKKNSQSLSIEITESQQQNNEDGSHLTLRDAESYTVEEIMQHSQWQLFIQKTAKVVYISERKHSCIAAGHIKLLQDKRKDFSLFSPKDNRFPRLMIPMSDCPVGFYQRPNDFASYLYLAQLEEWRVESQFAFGRLVQTLGNAGDVEPETVGILSEHGVDFSEFPTKVLDCLPLQSSNWTVPDDELSLRKDFRNKCLFTIDPATARDMDDAVSCECLVNGNYEIGVHIADVSYFVKENTALDDWACSRATSVYMVQKVIPMLPRLLCDNLCSLTPGEDRLTYSVLWEMTPDGEVRNSWFERSVIRSCIKMSYEHAQEIIENPLKTWEVSEHPPLHAPFTMSDIVARVFILHQLAVKLRYMRFAEGALQLNQTKLQFTLDKETGLPSGISAYEQKDSNKLIEEFMLLANMTVAKKIYDTFPDKAILRNHVHPQKKPISDVVTTCARLGIHLDASSSAALQTTLNQYGGDDEFSVARSLALTHLCSKPMNPAMYFCSGKIQNESCFHHFALNVPLYTHFTSPIRRYPDILVHRLLGAALGHRPSLTAEPKDLHAQALHSSDKKLNADRASEMSNELFFSAFVRKCGPMEARGIVVGLMDHSFDCLAFSLGIVKRIYCDKLPVKRTVFKKVQGNASLTLFWKEGDLQQTIMMFCLVDLLLIPTTSGPLQVNAILKKPPS